MSYQLLVIYRESRKNSQSLRFSLIISLLFALGLITPVSPVYPAHSSHSHILATYSVSGTVFDDYNQNGAQDSREPGLNGVVVTAYNSAVVESPVSSQLSVLAN